jgi:malonyl-CoA/methylmalonyl-CoA synthetase
VNSSPQIVARAFDHHRRIAIVTGERSYTFQQLLDASHAVAGRLLGARHDLDQARVAFCVAPGFEHVAVQWGIWRAGGVAVPLPMTHPRPELEFLIRDSGAAYVVTDRAGAERLLPIARATGAVLFQVEDGITVSAAPRADLPDVEPARRAMIVYTSGTTGRPKGVVTTHRNIEAQIVTVVTAWEWTPSDRALLVLPLYHVHGIINVVCSALWTGATCEILPRFDTEATWARLASGELTVFSAVPTIYHRLVQSWEAAPPDAQRSRSAGARKLRLMMSGSSALPTQLLARWEEITGHRLLERYGMTEVAMALSNPLHGERRPGFVGRPLPGITARLVADGAVVGEGVAGEVELKGDGIFLEYWRRPTETAAAFHEGWFQTGDAAIVENGDYRLLGRKSVDIIKSGAEKISALEIEEVLRRHPAIEECAVVGVADAEWGERICVAIETRPGSQLKLDELREWARAHLAASKIPRELRCVERLPRNSMGKVVKPEIATFFAPPAAPAPPKT